MTKKQEKIKYDGFRATERSGMVWIEDDVGSGIGMDFASAKRILKDLQKLL